MLELPVVTLDATLVDLYRRASPSTAHKRIAQVLCGINAAIPLTSNVPRNAKYLYQDGPFNSKPGEEFDGSPAAFQRHLAVKYLSLVAQRDAFVCGPTDAIFFHVDASPDQIAHDKQQAAETMAVLPEHQRPNLLLCPGPRGIPVKEAGIDLIAYKLVLDDLEEYDLVVPPETHWYLNSKAALAESGLPTPKCKAITIDGHGGEAASCCDLCRESADGFSIPTDCAGARGQWLKGQLAIVDDTLSSHPLPFVLKNQQTFGGAGTYFARTEDERQQLIRDLQGGILQRLLSSLTSSNVHLAPGTLLVSDIVAEPIADYGLTFFVTESYEEPIFLAASEQMIEDDKTWVGSTIDFGRQEELERKFGGLVKRIAGWLQGYGYVGPAGADVLETVTPCAKKQDETLKSESQLYVVDLNVRTSGSMCLPLLRSHFTSRGLNNAASFSISVEKSRTEFIDMFDTEFKTGRMCILSWYEDPVACVSLADVAVGAEDRIGLQKAMELVREAAGQVTF